MDKEQLSQMKPTALSRLITYLVVAGGLAAVAVLMGLDAPGAWVGTGFGGGSDALGATIPIANSPGEALAELVTAAAVAVIFAVPLAIAYTMTKRREGYDRAVVQMIIILPLVVSCVVLVVKGSLALAFTLAGIVAAVRFRATFRDVKDAVFGFAAIAIGLAAGVQSVVIAAGTSILFSLLTVALWKLDVGDPRADLTRFGGDVKLSDALVPIGNGDTVVHGEPELSASPEAADDVAREAAKLDRMIQLDTDNHKRKDRFTHLLLIHTSKVNPTREAVEDLLESNAKRWRFVSAVPYQNGSRTLEFLARLRASSDEKTLAAEITERGKDVAGVELKPVDGHRQQVA